MKLDSINVTVEGGLDFSFPPLTPVEQHFERQRLKDVGAHIADELQKIPDSLISGKSIALTVGSRGISRIEEITKALIDGLRNKGAEPFIVPAMGSHGGATAEGQTRVLAGYGITEERIGAPIRSSMEVVQVARLEDGTPLYCDRIAFEADAIVVANKIKPHADFKGSYESGLVKMLSIGLAKHKGAVALHDHGFSRFHELLPSAARLLLDKLPVVLGLAILENAFDELMELEVIPAEQIMSREMSLLERAKGSLARLLFTDIDLLIVDEIGKNISGEGMDPNVTGRPGSGLPGFESPNIQKIVVLDVTPQSQGNAVGIGMADFTTRHCVEKIDLGAMYTNAITATIPGPAKLPIIMNSDREAIAVALKTCNRTTVDNARIVRIRNTLEISHIRVSPALLPDVDSHPQLSVSGESEPLRFTCDGQLLKQ
ncbi:lactate racemase domain-containing protein [Granulosicoccus sp. 3-233]|uniref:lactate racemase domain-containing protein n=1 Tax=Granulosicoccus sp. 3-233 TaxID=3417969 RepID=UPI003D354294